jgi:hypothetical protein
VNESAILASGTTSSGAPPGAASEVPKGMPGG